MSSTTTPLKRILRTSDSSDERREAWEAAKTIGAVVADRVRELARLRNEAATSLGFRDWFALSVETMEMDETSLFATLDETERVTREPFAPVEGGRRPVDRGAVRHRPGGRSAALALRRPVLPGGADDAGGIDLDAVFAGQPTSSGSRSARSTRSASRRRRSSTRSDLFPRDGKCQHAFCLDVDREGDIRVLANVVHDRYWAETMLHELGHAVHSAGFDPSLPWLLRDSI